MEDPNRSTRDGTLSPHDFHVAAKALMARWKQIDPPSLPQWTWVPRTTLPLGASSNGEEGYLCLENVHHINLNQEDKPSLLENEEPIDSATLVESHIDETHIYDFHIVYDFSFRVPVLYFRGCRCDGQPLSLDDIEKDLPHHSLGILRESRWTYMTQEEHPYLHRPWYTLHPCGTSEWMKLLYCDTVPPKDPEIQWYLLSWLSVVGQAVGLKVPLELQIKSFDGCAASSSVDG